MKTSHKVILSVVLISALAATVSITTRGLFQEIQNAQAPKKRKPKGFDNPRKFVEVHREMRTPDDMVRPGYEAGYKIQELSKANNRSLQHSRVGRTSSDIVWTERGPGNVPGRTRALLNINDPSNNVWLAGAATGGIWKTENGGSTWDEKNDNLTALPVSSFASDDAQTRIYACTGEFVSTLFSAMGDGIFVSTDKGNTWNILPSTRGNPDFAIVTRLIVDPANADIVVATTAPSNLSSDITSSIMRSTNGGTTWTKVKEVTGTFEQIIFTPGDFDVQYASQNSVGVWKSVDAGLTWNLSNTGMTPSGRLELAVSPVNSNMIFASAEGTSTGVESDLYVSTDAGTTWGLVEMKFLNATVDFLGNTAGEVDSQGFYDNTILCDPFNANIVYVGGVNLFRATLGSQSGSFDAYEIEEENTASFLTLQAFSNIGFDNGRLTVGSEADLVPVEIRFGPGLKQLAHRFLVPANQTSGIPVENYSFSSYVEIPFQVWDTQSNRQLMVSFRDQNRNGIFDLVNEFLTSDGSGALLNSREYIYIHNLAYQTTQHPGIATAGGQENFLMYNLFPALRSGATWTPASLPLSKVKIGGFSIAKHESTTITVADAYGNFDNKNPVNQTNLVNGMHPDHHFMTAIITNAANKEYKILLGNDGGVFVSNASTVPGTTQNSWTFKGFGYNTSQFYGADKRPGHDQYIGGMQDNGTRISPATGTIDATSEYAFAIGGDGFDVLWNTRDETLVLGSVYNGNIYRSTNGGTTFNAATSGISESSIFPFFTKLAHSKDFPNRVFTIAADGVYVSQNFGASWKLTSIPEHLVTNSASLLDVEVSRANPNIVWAGSGMNNNTNEERHLFVSTDGGTTFSETNNFSGALLGSITKLASHPTEPNTAYALFSFADRPKILRTTDLGQTWKDLSGFGANTSSNNGFPDVATFCLYVRPDDPSILWAGTEIGIFESLDEGQSWSLIPDFPKVAVWDMKGQDNQVVISTHGRGIWTATLPSAQSDFIGAAKIAAAGMAPREALAIRVMIGIDADSVSVFVDKNLNRTIKNITAGTHDYFIKGLAKGNRNIHLITYESGAPFLSPTVTAPVIDLGTVKTNYSTTFSSASEFSLEELTLQRIHAKQNNLSLKTGSPYKNNSTYSALLTEPIKISATLPKLFYKDIAITEPGHDQVVLQSTKNGLDWTNLIAPYDASFSPEWQTAFNQQDTAKRSAMVMHEITLTDFYNVTDTVLFRWSLTTDAQNTAWGWAMDHLSIQELPVATEVSKTVEALSVFPNPAVNEISIRYYLHERSNVTVRLVDVSGRPVVTRDVGTRNPGSQTAGLDVRAVTPGIYILEVATRRSKETRKILIER